jgi:nicotinamide-nucleotide adenylyltransferase
MEHVGRIGMVARWRPVHLGQAPVLRALCEHGERALIGIGSSNTYDARNPFTFEETCTMIRLVLAGRSNYELLPVPDLHDGPRWRELVVALFGPLDVFVTDNAYVRSLLAGDYRIVRPVTLVPRAERVPLDGTMVRDALARGEAWREMVPAVVAQHIVAHGLDQRFRREFGLATLTQGLKKEGSHVLVG